MKHLIYMAISLMAFSCAAKKEAIITDTSKLQQVLKVSKTPCFGYCPVFTLTIYNNGLAVLDGKQNIDQIGLSHKVLDKKHMQSLMKACEEGQLFSLKDSYEQKIMDLPTTTLSYTANGKTKTIKGNKDFPKGFEDVISHCMKIVKGEGWELKEAYNTK